MVRVRDRVCRVGTITALLQPSIPTPVSVLSDHTMCGVPEPSVGFHHILHIPPLLVPTPVSVLGNNTTCSTPKPRISILYIPPPQLLHIPPPQLLVSVLGNDATRSTPEPRVSTTTRARRVGPPPPRIHIILTTIPQIRGAGVGSPPPAVLGDHSVRCVAEPSVGFLCLGAEDREDSLESREDRSRIQPLHPPHQRADSESEPTFRAQNRIQPCKGMSLDSRLDPDARLRQRRCRQRLELWRRQRRSNVFCICRRRRRHRRQLEQRTQRRQQRLGRGRERVGEEHSRGVQRVLCLSRVGLGRRKPNISRIQRVCQRKAQLSQADRIQRL